MKCEDRACGSNINGWCHFEADGHERPLLCSGSITLARDHEELLRRFCHYRDALDYCLATLKHHHATKRGISALIAKTEKIKDRTNADVHGK